MPIQDSPHGPSLLRESHPEAEGSTVRPSSNLSAFDHPAVLRSFTTAHDERWLDANLIVKNIRCAGCSGKVERLLRAHTGVQSAELNFATHRARVRFCPDETPLSDILANLADNGYPANPYDPEQTQAALEAERRERLRHLGVAALCSAQLMAVSVALYTGAWWGMDAAVQWLLRTTALVLCLPVIGYSAVPFMRGALRDLRALQPGMDVPVSLGLCIAFGGSVYAIVSGGGEIYFDSVAMFTLLLSIARYVEFTQRRKNTLALEQLSASLPAMAMRIEVLDADTQQVATRLVPAAELAAGDRVEVGAGQVIPADGVLTCGSTEADESLLTGEPMPLKKRPGDTLLAGSCVTNGPIQMQVSQAAQHSVAGQIGQLVARSLAEKSDVSRLTELVAKYFVSAVLLLTVATALWCYWYAPERLLPTVIAVLVVTCPCALALATPCAISAALIKLSSQGVLVVRSSALEVIARATHLVFDKTGTLTVGKPVVAEIKSLRSSVDDAAIQAAAVTAIASALERHTVHPLGRAIETLTTENSTRAHSLRTSAGGGVAGVVEGQPYALGNLGFVLHEMDLALTATEQERLALLPGTATYLADNQGLLARFGFADEIRPEAVQALRNLRDQHMSVMLLSGDRAQPVSEVADNLGITVFEAELDPWEKRMRLQALREEGAITVMIGDGLNDAPVLAEADASFAMGSGAPLSLLSASVVLIQNDLRQISVTMAVARRCQRIIVQNLWWAATYNLIAIPAAVMGLLPPWLAAAGMSLSSLLVVLNSARAGSVPHQPCAPVTSAGTEANRLAGNT
jgi:Cu2+-exporting ATPase